MVIMKKYVTLCDITIDNEKTFKIKVIPKGTILTETYDGGMFESKKPVMCVGETWVLNNPQVYKKVVDNESKRI